LCLSLGAGVIRPLAEMLAVQERTRARQRLTDLLLAFGALGRQSAEQLKSSANPSVRRVAVHLLREFGGTEALPDLESLLDDAEPHVQREAVRAILLIGTDEAYAVLERALRSCSAQSRETILQQLDSAGDERAAPLFSYIVRRGDYRKGRRAIYLKAVSALGRLGGDEAIDALKLALYRGEWWAPLRTAELRGATARSLQQIGAARAIEVLEEAADHGSHGVRTATRPSLAKARDAGEATRPHARANGDQTGMPGR
jgi:HEAT repeat protein